MQRWTDRLTVLLCLYVICFCTCLGHLVFGWTLNNCEPVFITVYWKQTVKQWIVIRLSNAEVVSPSLFKLHCWFDGLWTAKYSSVAVFRQRFQSSVLDASDETLLLVSVHLHHSTLTLCKQNMKCTIIVVVHWALSGAKTHKRCSVMA